MCKISAEGMVIIMRKLNIILSVIILTALMTGCTVTSYNENIDEILKGAQKTDFLSRDHDYMKQLEAYDSTASALPAQTDEDGGFFDDFAEGLSLIHI